MNGWNEVRVEHVSGRSTTTRVGEPFEVLATVRLGPLAPGDVRVQVYHGHVDARAQLEAAEAIDMEHLEERDGLHRYRAALPIGESGRHGYTVRVIPHHPSVMVPQELTEIRWA
ncbi:MAG: glycosyltransferase family 1 protein [Myxococcales bacterium]|nr:glycosyltransferase family 1 protein [Myxococcales bacterium]